MKYILIIFILLTHSITFAYEVNIYDAPHRNKIVIELIDDCNFSHKLVTSIENASTYKSTDWLELLIISGEWNKCKKVVD